MSESQTDYPPPFNPPPLFHSLSAPIHTRDFLCRVDTRTKKHSLLDLSTLSDVFTVSSSKKEGGKCWRWDSIKYWAEPEIKKKSAHAHFLVTKPGYSIVKWTYNIPPNPSRKPEVDGGQGYCVARVNNESERSSGRTRNNAIAQLFDGPFDCGVMMKKSANGCDVGPLAIRPVVLTIPAR